MSFAPSTQKQPFLFQSANVIKSIKTGTAVAVLAALFLAACANHPSGEMNTESRSVAQDASQTVIVSTLAGSEQDFADGQGDVARFNHPVGIAIDAAGNLYVADQGNHCIRKITPNGEVSTLAGGMAGFADGERLNAQFSTPLGIAIDVADNLYVADWGNYRIRKVTPGGEVSTLVDDWEDGGSFADSDASVARFHQPSGIAMDRAGNLYVTDTRNHRIRKVTQKGEISTLAGGKEGFADGEGHNAQFRYPEGIAIDTAGNLYVADIYNHRIRKVTMRGEVSTLAGSGSTGYDKGGFVDGEGQNARFNEPRDIAIDAVGNLYVTDSGNHRIRKVTPEGEVNTLAGSGPTGPYVIGFVDGEGQNARFNEPRGIAIDAMGNLYVTDSGNHRIRKIVIERP